MYFPFGVANPMLCDGCHLRLANLGSSRFVVRWGTCASLTSSGLHNSASDCLRLANIQVFLRTFSFSAMHIDFSRRKGPVTDSFGAVLFKQRNHSSSAVSNLRVSIQLNVLSESSFFANLRSSFHCIARFPIEAS